MADETQDSALPIAYVGVEDVPILYANHFVMQFLQDEFVLVFGQVTPPIILRGSEEERREQARKLPYVPVKVVARYAFTRARVEELMGLLQRQLERYDQEKAQQGG